MTENRSGSAGALRYLPYLLLALVLAATAYVRLRLLTVPLERDEGEYAYIGQLLLKGAPPYLYAYSMKLPGTSLMYALFMGIFGQTPFGVHLGLFLVNALSIWLVYLLGVRLLSREAGLFSCASFALLSLSKTVYGSFAHATNFIVVFALAGLVLLLRPGAVRRAPFLLASGLCFGLAFTMKQPAALFALFAFIYLCRELYRDSAAPRGARLTGPLLFLAGCLIPYALVLVWVAGAGSFGHFWLWTVAYASKYASSQPLGEGIATLFRALRVICTPQWPLWLLALAGGVFLAAGRPRGANRLFLGGFLLFSFLAVSPGLYYRWHYFILILPAVSLLIGAAAAAFGELAPGRDALRTALPVLVLALALGYGFYKERLCFFQLSPVQVSYSSYGPSAFPVAPEIGAYLKEHTTERDRVAVLGSEPEIYFYAGRLSATGHIYMYSLMEDHPYAAGMQQEMIRQIEESKPKYCVFSKMDYSWLVGPNSRREIFRWIDNYLKEHYEQVGVTEVFDGSSRSVWDAAALNYLPASDAPLIVYRRKG